MSRLITKNYSTSPKVPMGIQGLTWTPTSQMQGFGARPSSFQRTRIKKPLKIDKILTKMSILGRFRSSKSFKLWWSSTKPLILYCGGPSWPPDTHGYPGGGGVVFSNESGQLDVIPVSVVCPNLQSILMDYIMSVYIAGAYPTLRLSGA